MTNSLSSVDRSSNATRSSLLRRAAAEDEQAWCELVELYGPLISHWARQCGADEHSAADRVQDVFASVARSLHQFKSRRTGGEFRNWLWTITRNKIRDANRRQAVGLRPTGGSTAHQLISQVADVTNVPDEEPTEATELQELIHRAMAQIQVDFAPQSWQAFWRSAIENIPTDIVAKELGVTPAAVRQSRSRILRRLRQQLGDL